jgi:hypothetical protein
MLNKKVVPIIPLVINDNSNSQTTGKKFGDNKGILRKTIAVYHD